MTRKLAIATFVALAVCASPLVGAWGSKGGAEPDTARDMTDGWMYLTADTSPCGAAASPCATEQVYLNGIMAQQADVVGTDINPNVATLGTANYFADENFRAIFGVWKDCNGDGFIGLGDQGLWDYHADLLSVPAKAGVGPGFSICPVQSEPAGGPPANGNWFPVHNDGTWIREFIPIGWSDQQSVTGDHDPWNLNDNNARVWADYGLPEDKYTPTCPLFPVERGTFGSVGGLLHTYDCREGFTVTDKFDSVADSNPTLQPYSFSDHSRDQQNSASKANVKNPWGQSSDAGYAQVWDCSQGPITGTSLGNVPEVGWTRVNVSHPSTAPSVNPTRAGASPSGTMNDLGSGFDQCHRPTGTDDQNGAAPQGLLWRQGSDNFHAGKTLANAPYLLEYDVASTPARVTPDDWMDPITPFGSQDSYPHSPFDKAGHPDWPSPTNLQLDNNKGEWAASHQWTNPFLLQKYQLQTGGVYHTFYGYTSLTNVQTPHSGLGTYGAEACGGSTTGIHNGWQCDATKWWRDSQNNDLKSSARSTALGPLQCSTSGAQANCGFYGATVGDPYNLRDIDCYDQSTNAQRSVGATYANLDGGVVCK